MYVQFCYHKISFAIDLVFLHLIANVCYWYQQKQCFLSLNF